MIENRDYIETTLENLKEDEYHRTLSAKYGDEDIEAIEEVIKSETTDLLKGLDESKIIRGKMFKNYKEMCSELNIPYKTSQTKIKQMKELEVYYFLYKQDGYRIKITKVHNLNDIEKRVRTLKSNYKDYIEELIVNIMIDEVKKREDKYGKNETTLGEPVILSQGQLARAIGMVNKHYATVMSNKHTHCKLKEYDIDIFEDWSNSFYGFMRGSIRSAIENLRDKRLIIYEMKVAVCEFSQDKVVKLRDIDGDEYLGTENKDRRVLKVRLATDTEKNKISELENQVLSNLGVNSVSELFKTHGNFGFERYSHLLSELLVKELNIRSHFLTYSLNFSNDVIKRYVSANGIDFSLTASAKKQYANEMNKLVIQKIQTNTETRHNKAIQTLNEVDEFSWKLRDVRRADEKYPIQCQDIANDVLSLNIRTNPSQAIKDRKNEVDIIAEKNKILGK